MSEQPKCELCGEPMPVGEEMFKYHGHYLPIPMADVFKNDLSSAVAKDLAEFLIRDYENERPGALSNAG